MRPRTLEGKKYLCFLKAEISEIEKTNYENKKQYFRKDR